MGNIVRRRESADIYRFLIGKIFDRGIMWHIRKRDDVTQINGFHNQHLNLYFSQIKRFFFFCLLFFFGVFINFPFISAQNQKYFWIFFFIRKNGAFILIMDEACVLNLHFSSYSHRARFFGSCTKPFINFSCSFFFFPFFISFPFGKSKPKGSGAPFEKKKYDKSENQRILTSILC